MRIEQIQRLVRGIDALKDAVLALAIENQRLQDEQRELRMRVDPLSDGLSIADTEGQDDDR